MATMPEQTRSDTAVLERIKMALRQPGLGSYVEYARWLRDAHDELMDERARWLAKVERVRELLVTEIGDGKVLGVGVRWQRFAVRRVLAILEEP